MTEYARPLWLGGGISYEALELVEHAILHIAGNQKDAMIRMELNNVANACRAEIQRRPANKVCDLI